MEKERIKLNHSALEDAPHEPPPDFAELDRLLASLPEEMEVPPPDLDFDGRVERVLTAVRTDRVFAVNFKNSPLLALEDVLGQNLSDDELRLVYEEVRRRLSPVKDRSELVYLHMLKQSPDALAAKSTERIRPSAEKMR
jgi:hypothetical protein